MSGAPKVLLVDDNEALLDNLGEILGDAGYQVQMAKTCATARQVPSGGGFDVALVDLRLPDGEGTALAGELKTLLPDSEVVLLTGHATVESASAAVRAGAFAYLVKPVATRELLLTLEQALRQKRIVVEKRELAERAQVAERLATAGTLTAGLSHEIRNPLNAAKLQLTVLERRVKKLEPAQQQPLLEPLKLVEDEIRRLDHILEDFLQLARPRAIRPETVELAALANRVVHFMGADAEQRGVSLVHQVPAEARVRGGEDPLRQVVMNLVLNALDATPRGGTVRICAERNAPDRMRLLVDDSGPGLPIHMRNRVFEPFYTTKATGTGLGLSIVHTLITQMGGTIRVEDSPLGGARFSIELPLASDALGT